MLECMKSKGPLVTLAAVVALGGGLWAVNVQHTPPEPASAAAAARPAATAAVSPTPKPAPPPPAAPDPFAAKANFAGKIPTATGTITLEITVRGTEAVAYACDGRAIEAWLRGSARGGALALSSKGATSSLTGEHHGNTVTGTLKIGEKSWKFTTSEVDRVQGTSNAP
ncbi:hypothetical protein BN977_03183 [Mycolicibacterium cosmeticum]|uniref:Uncharacterized protein n=2 Tax=Mycolicibacterium cosmeticum TaxID=258533 RepID=W9ARG2_MYCCO|nr:hypothetical protein BN977_03183 [Mycolicibacterium cosmeticum]